MIDNKTPRLQLPKPDPDNYLDDDVVRLQQAFDILDSAATVGDDGKIHDEQIPAGIARRDSPTFTGIPKSPTALADDSSTQIANTKFVADAVSKVKSDISGDVPDDLSTLEKLALAIANNPEFAQAVSDAIALRAMKGENSDITSLSGLTTPLSTQQGGTGSTIPFGTTAGKFCQGNDSRLNTIDGKSGGKIADRVNIGVNITGWGTGVYTGGEARTYQYISRMQEDAVWQVEQYGVDVLNDRFEYRLLVNKLGNIKTLAFRQDNGNASVPGTFVSGSDIRHKSNLAFVDNALSAVCSFRGMIYDKKDGAREVGLIAQDVEKKCPAAISTVKREFSDGMVIDDFKMLNTSGVAAAYHTEAIKSIVRLLKKMLDDPDGARVEINALLGAMNNQIS